MGLFGEKKLGFGLMRLPITVPGDATSINIPLLCDMVDHFLEQGFTYFDTAWLYHGFKSECAVKEALVSRYPRDRFTLATKLHGGFIETAEDCDRVFSEQLRKTGVEYFDYYLLHDIGQDHYRKYTKLDCFNWLMDKKARGLVKHIGFSYHDDAELLDRVLSEHPEFEFVQLQLNYIDWESAGVQSRKCYEVAVKHGVPVVVMEPVKGGTLANVPESAERLFRQHAPDMSVPSWAVRFAASHDNVQLVLSGMSDMAQMLDNTSYMKDFVPLTEAEKAIVMQAVDAINANIAIPCTGCAYCVEGCPMNIDIPAYFSLYNLDMQEVTTKSWRPQGEYYTRMTMVKGKASECVGCGQCEGVCPQHLPVTEYLRQVAERFEK